MYCLITRTFFNSTTFHLFYPFDLKNGQNRPETEGFAGTLFILLHIPFRFSITYYLQN